MKDISSFFFSGRSGISSPVFFLPKMDDANLIFSSSSCIFSFDISSAMKEGWNLTSSMYSESLVSFDLSTKLRGR